MKKILMRKHAELIRTGNFNIAGNILELMRCGSLWLGDRDEETEQILISCGVLVRHVLAFSVARIH